MPKKQDETIYDAEFTETSADDEPDSSSDDTDKSLVIADTLSPLDPTESADTSAKLNVKSLLLLVGVIALLAIAALYLRGLQLASV